MHVTNLPFPIVLTQCQYIGNWSSSTPGEDVNIPDDPEADHHPLHHRRPVGGTTKTKWRPSRLMILGPLRSSQTGTWDCDNPPASPHHTGWDPDIQISDKSQLHLMRKGASGVIHYTKVYLSQNSIFGDTQKKVGHGFWIFSLEPWNLGTRGPSNMDLFWCHQIPNKLDSH